MRCHSIVAAIFASFITILVVTGSARASGYTLTVNAQGSGSVIPDNVNNPHPPGVTITITATASNGWYFSNWSGDASGTVNPLQVTMNSNLSITGNFLPFPTYSLTLVTNGQGAVMLSPSGGIYNSNTTVVATAAPATGWVFTGWSGSTNASTNIISIVMDTNEALTASFAQLPAFDVQPSSVTNGPGSTITFSSHAIGDVPMLYQWFFSGGTLVTATNATLSLTNIAAGQAGNYWAIATNMYGSATSQVVSLTITNTGGPTNIVTSPTEANLRAAIALGGWVGLDFSGTITIANTIIITNNVILDGNNVAATISGGNAVRLFYVTNGASLTITNVTVANGNYTLTSGAPGTDADAGAIYNNGGTVILVGCTLTNNTAQSLVYGGLACGGALYNKGGTVNLWQSILVSNTVVGGGPNNISSPQGTTGTGAGGAVYNASGIILISGCNLNGNLAYGVCEPQGTAQALGGAAFLSAGTINIGYSSFTGNQAIGGSGAGAPAAMAAPAYGGAVSTGGGNLIINNSKFLNNSAGGGNAGFDGSGAPAYGGAICAASTLTILDTSLAGNQAIAGSSVDYHTVSSVNGSGGAIYNSGSATMNRCLVCSNFVEGGLVGSYSFERTKGFQGLGGGIFNASQFVVTNSTIALNIAEGGAGQGSGNGTTGDAIGGGIFNNSSATLVAMNLTIASNLCSSPSGVQTSPGFTAGYQVANTNGTFSLHNTLLANGNANNNAYGVITDVGYNICSDNSANLNSGYSYNNTAPQLAPLGNYGGPTWCMALLASSPAIDFGDLNGCPPTDQRGYVRPAGAGPDIGAFEYGSMPSMNLSLVPSGNNLQLSFPATTSVTYYLQCSSNMKSWATIDTNGPFAAATNVIQTVGTQGGNCRFFRVLMQ